jgi:dihydroorotate dehydrogenase (fumarate)
VEERYIDIVKAVKAAVTVPVAVKLSPFFSAIGAMAKALDEVAYVRFASVYRQFKDINHFMKELKSLLAKS